jgi:DNA helicase-2/ATP-dependent DNA helicase PcrA
MVDEQVFPARAQSAVAVFLKTMEEIREAVANQPLGQALRYVIERSGYKKMLDEDKSPEAESRQENLNELVNAAVEATERGEGVVEFLDHAALVSEADSVDECAQVNLLTLHNAKGLEFPIVFLAGMEDGLFPHIRSLDDVNLMEEERRLCYVGMTRAEKRLYLTWAKYRRRYGGGEQERTLPSRFLKEVPRHLIDNLSAYEEEPASQVDLSAESYEVAEIARRNAFTGRTYNSMKNISDFFGAGVRGGGVRQPDRKQVSPAVQAAKAGPPGAKRKSRLGATVNHPKYGKGTIVRLEGEGEDAKLTVSFPGHGIKKLVEKYAGFRND